jgi:three-Cys-motif partner protein
VWHLEPHSKIKHEILRQYINAWLPIMTSGTGRVVIVDGFAGPGEYADGELGSPLIMLKSCLDHRAQPSARSEVVFRFIEERADRAEHLKERVAALGELPVHVKVQVVQGKYEEHFQRVLDGLVGTGSTLAPTFAFIDPFGYSQASMTLTGRFLQFRRCEVLVYMPLPFVSRFVDRADQASAMDTLFGCGNWRDAKTLAGRERREFLRNLFERQLRKCGSEYVEQFEIVTSTGGGYFLFYGTKHLTGVRRMRDILWKMDPAQGCRFKEDGSSTNGVGDLPFEPDTSRVMDVLCTRFGKRAFSIRAAEDAVLQDTTYRYSVKHLRPALKRAEQSHNLEVISSTRQKRGAYPEGTMMRFPG